MKRLFLMLLATVSLIACDKGDETPKPIELTGDTQTSQTIYADETQKSEGIKFKATAPWTAAVSEVTSKANDKESWLRLSAYEGGAGDVTLAISLDQNDTGRDRKAEIRIICGGITITIVVEQKATNRPEDPDKPKPDMRYVKKFISRNSFGYESEMAFEYDNQMRIAKIVNKETYNGVIENSTNNIYFHYKDNTISLKSSEVKNGVEQETEDMADITLNPNGTVKQSITVPEEHYVPEPESVMFSQITRSAASKAPTNSRFVCDYTYDAQGYVTKVTEREEKNGVITKNNDYSVSWSDSNLAKLETTYYGNKESDEFKYSNIENKPCNWDMTIQSTELSFNMFDVIGQLGLMGKKSKNLPSSQTNRYNARSYTYTLDKDGYVVSITEKSGSTYNNNTTIEYVK